MGEVSGGGPGRSREPTRREFVDTLLATSLGISALATLIPVAAYLVPPLGGEPGAETVVLPFPAEELAPSSGRVVKFGNRPALVVRTPAGDVRAFDARCTHLSCIVQYAPQEQRILCACHNGWYDLTGRNVAGPPPRPLEAFQVNLRRRKEGGHDVVVSRA